MIVYVVVVGEGYDFFGMVLAFGYGTFIDYVSLLSDSLFASLLLPILDLNFDLILNIYIRQLIKILLSLTMLI